MAKKDKKVTRAAQVAVIIGSESDLPRVVPALETLEEFGVGYELRIASAHRTPEYLEEIVNKFTAEGGRVIIAAAGKAAHLPGVIASITHMPVIGIPISASLDGLDALLSIVQMPPGMPVATVGIDAAKNAALLAIQILSLDQPALTKKLKEDRQNSKKKIKMRSEEIARKGWKKL
ncbi:MAG: 5-(carboxyamino)imidazole ribonucleotide mutase [bacterium]